MLGLKLILVSKRGLRIFKLSYLERIKHKLNMLKLRKHLSSCLDENKIHVKK